MSIIEKLFVSSQFFETNDVINYGSGWRKDVVKQYVEFGLVIVTINVLAVAAFGRCSWTARTGIASTIPVLQ